MPVQKAYTTVIGPITVTAGTTTSLSQCTLLDLSKATQLTVTFVGTFNASATNGAKVTFWPSYDGTNFDSSTWRGMEWTITATPGSQKIETWDPIAPVPKYMKFKIENLDTSYDITSCSLIATVQTVG